MACLSSEGALEGVLIGVILDSLVSLLIDSLAEVVILGFLENLSIDR